MCDNFQAGQQYTSDSGCLLVKVLSANGSMCAGELLEYDFNAEKFNFIETFLLSHDTIEEMLCDDDEFDPDDGEEMIVVFTPEWSN